MAEKKAAMAAKLVGMKNVSTYGSVELRLHMPQELALKAIQIFGWPTMEAPISVAIARLDVDGGCQEQPSAQVERPDLTGVAPGPLDEPPAWPLRGRHWSDLSPAAQTGIIRNEPAFWEFARVSDADGARDYIRGCCLVGSCADIVPRSEAAARWAQLQVRYGAFLRQRSNAA